MRSLNENKHRSSLRAIWLRIKGSVIDAETAIHWDTWDLNATECPCRPRANVTCAHSAHAPMQIRLAIFSQHHVDGMDLALCPLTAMKHTYPGVKVRGSSP